MTKKELLEAIKDVPNEADVIVAIYYHTRKNHATVYDAEDVCMNGKAIQINVFD